MLCCIQMHIVNWNSVRTTITKKIIISVYSHLYFGILALFSNLYRLLCAYVESEESINKTPEQALKINMSDTE